ncbi:MAG: SPOR domain-containing protein [Hyphomicrobiaceae bacterium]
MHDPATSLPLPDAVTGYRLQLAAVRDRAEAQEMIDQVRGEGGPLAKRNFEIVEDVYGNMGRFYRVRIGRFAEATDALAYCAELRSRRFDCMVLDR